MRDHFTRDTIGWTHVAALLAALGIDVECYGPSQDRIVGVYLDAWDEQLAGAAITLMRDDGGGKSKTLATLRVAPVD